jgi:hypothetical protein
MPRFKVEGFGNEVKEAEAGSFAPYDGPIPPKNTLLRVKVKQLKMKVNKNNNFMLNCVVEVDMPEGHPSAKYNGCPAWWNGNLTKESAGYVNAFLKSIAGSEIKGKKLINEFWDKGVNLIGGNKPTKENPLGIAAIGSMKIDADNPPTGYILSKTKKNFQDKSITEMDVAEWVLPKSATEGEKVDDDGEVVDEVEEEDGVEVEQEDSDVTDEDDENDTDEDDENDTDEDDGQYSDEPPF